MEWLVIRSKSFTLEGQALDSGKQLRDLRVDDRGFGDHFEMIAGSGTGADGGCGSKTKRRKSDWHDYL
jgi:hypothetical protein